MIKFSAIISEIGVEDLAKMSAEEYRDYLSSQFDKFNAPHITNAFTKSKKVPVPQGIKYKHIGPDGRGNDLVLAPRGKLYDLRQAVYDNDITKIKMVGYEALQHKEGEVARLILPHVKKYDYITQATTGSLYIHIGKKELRVADHSSGAPVGRKARTSITPDHFDLYTNSKNIKDNILKAIEFLNT